MLDANGYVLKSVMKKAQNGAYYCTDSNGQIYRNKLVKYGNFRYYFGSNGKRATWTKRWAKAGDHYYYFGSTPGRVVEKHGGRNLSAPVANSLAGCILIPREIIIRISGLPQVIILNHQESLQAV